MLVRVSSSKGGFGEYMKHGRKEGREESRDTLDDRLILAGDLEEFEQIITEMDGDGQKYLHITLSFAEHYVDDDTLRAINDDFQSFVRAGYRDQNELYIYGEAHRPKVKEAIDTRNGEINERLVHIHYAVPLQNMLTGTREDPLGLLMAHGKGGKPGNTDAQVMQWRDAFQEYINQKYGLISPKDRPREVGGEAEAKSRYKGDEFPGMGTVRAKKEFFSGIALHAASAQEFRSELEKLGEVKIVNEGKANEYFGVKVTGAPKFMYLKEGQFRPEFLNLSFKEKAERITRDPDKYRDANPVASERANPYASKMADWREFGAVEMRFAGSHGRRARYGITAETTREERIAILKTREAKFYKKHAAAFDLEVNHEHGRELARGLGRGSGSDAWPHPDPKFPALGSGGADQQVGEVGIRPLPDLRPAGHEHGRNRDGDDLLPGALPRHQDGDHALHSARGRESSDPRQGEQVSGLLGRLKAATASVDELDAAFPGDNVLDQIGRQMTDRIRQAEARERTREIRENLDPNRLLASLAESHRVNTKLYQVEGQKIIAGRRSLSVNDFLTKEIFLKWPEAERILHANWQAQQRGEPYRDPVLARQTDTDLHRQFQEWKKANVEAAKEARTAIDNARLGAIRDMLKARGEDVPQKLETRPESLSVARMEQAFDERAFLVERANQSDHAAFDRLRRMPPEPCSEFPGNAATGERLRAHEPLPPAKDMGKFSWRVDRSGAVSYYDQEGRFALRDERNRVTSNREEREVFEAQFALAVAKFDGSPLKLRGSDTFVDGILDVAARHPKDVRFSDAALQERYATAREAWQAEQKAQAKAPERVDLAGAQSLDQVRDRTLLQAFEKDSVVTNRRFDELTKGLSNAAEIRRSLAAELVEVGADEWGRSLYSSRAILQREVGMLDDATVLARGTRHTLDDAAVEHAIAAKEAEATAKIGKPASMSDEQKAAVRHAMQAGDLSIIQGSAGAGKSFSMEAVKLGYQEAGYQVLGAAIAKRAAQNLQDETGIESFTVAKLLSDLDAGKRTLTDKTAVIVDEAGQVGVGDMSRLLGHVRKADAKLLLTGEDRQLDAIQHGGALRFLSQSEIVGTSRIMNIQRQNQEWARQMVADLRDGKAREGFEALEKRGLVKEIEGGAGRVQDEMVKQWKAYEQANPDKSALLLAHKNCDVRALSERVREIRKAEGRVTGPEHQIQATASGQDYKLALAQGDRIKFNKNDEKGVGVINGTLGTLEKIEAIDDGKDYSLTVKTDDRGTVNFNLSKYQAENGRAPLSHAYAMTIYASQGVTVKGDVFMQQSASMDRAASYVAASRARENTHVFIDRDEFAAKAEKSGNSVREEVIESMGRDRFKTLAIEHLAKPEAQRQEPVRLDQKPTEQPARPAAPVPAPQDVREPQQAEPLKQKAMPEPQKPAQQAEQPKGTTDTKPDSPRTLTPEGEKRAAQQAEPRAAVPGRQPVDRKALDKATAEVATQQGKTWDGIERRKTEQPVSEDRRKARDLQQNANQSAEKSAKIAVKPGTNNDASTQKNVSPRASKAPEIKKPDTPKPPSSPTKKKRRGLVP